jgi:hypothetical protein
MAIKGQITRQRRQDDSEETASPRKGRDPESRGELESLKAYEYELPWRELGDKAAAFTGNLSHFQSVQSGLEPADTQLHPKIQPQQLQDGLPLLKLASSGSVSAENEKNFFVTYENPGSGKTAMLISHYYDAEHFLQAVCRQLADSSIILHCSWPRLLIGQDKQLVDKVRHICQCRSSYRRSISETRKTCLRLPVTDHLRPQNTEASIWQKVNNQEYWTHLAADEPFDGQQSLAQSLNKAEYIGMMDQPRSARWSVPYLKLGMLHVPCKVNKELCLTSIFLKPESVIKFLGARNPSIDQALSLLGTCTQMSVYLPKRQSTVHISDSQISALISKIEPNVIYKGLFESFRRKQKPSQEAKEEVAYKLSGLITEVGHKGVNLSIDLDKKAEKSLPYESSIAEIKFKEPLVTQKTLSEGLIEEFYTQIRKFDADLRRHTTAVFLRHYNSVKKIFGTERLYLTFSYGGIRISSDKHYTVRIDYVELGSDKSAIPEVILTLDFYSNDDQERLIKIERNGRSVEKLMNCMQMADAWMQSYTLQNSMCIKKTIMGRKVIVDKQLIIKEELQAHSGDEYLKVLLISKRIHKVVKEDIEGSQVHLITSIENLGKCYATVEFITSLRNKHNEASTLISIDLSPVEYRLKLLKVILNHNDISSLFKANIGEMLNDRGRLLKLFQKVISSLTLTRKLHYSIPSLPLSNIDPSCNKHITDLKEHFINDFNKYSLKTQTGLDCKPFFQRKHKESWILHKKVSKVASHD